MIEETDWIGLFSCHNNQSFWSQAFFWFSESAIFLWTYSENEAVPDLFGGGNLGEEEDEIVNQVKKKKKKIKFLQLFKTFKFF